MGATSCQSSTTLSCTIQSLPVLPGTSSTRSHFSSIANWTPQSWSFAFVYWCSMSLHHSDQMSQGSGCFTNSLCLCLLVNGQVMSPRHSDQMSLVPGSYLWVPGGYMSVKEGYKYAVVFPHVSLRGKMYFLRSERSKLTNCIMIKVCELVECRLWITLWNGPEDRRCMSGLETHQQFHPICETF